MKKSSSTPLHSVIAYQRIRDCFGAQFAFEAAACGAVRDFGKSLKKGELVVMRRTKLGIAIANHRAL